MKASPRFSVIMNVFNGERFLRETLASLFAQTFRDWELIFWDDQSSDASARILKSFPADDRVRFFRAAEHVSLVRARELAIAEARGEWLAFLDQDDLWTPDKLEKQARLIDSHNADELAIVYGRAMKFGDIGMVQDFDHRHEFRELPDGDIFESLFVDSCYICQSAACLRTDLVRGAGPIPSEFECCNDYFLYTVLASRYKAACTQDVVCWYRVHENAMTNKFYTQALQEASMILERWKPRLDPAVYQSRRKIQGSIIGLREIASGEDVAGGFRRILREGSVAYLLSRPFARSYRFLRRVARRAFRGAAKKPAFP